MRILFIICFYLLFTACTSLPVTHNSSRNVSSNTVDNSYIKSSTKKHSHKAYESAYGLIQMDDNKRVDKWINYFQTRGRERMHTYLSRSYRYLPMMKKIMRDNNLPEELVYVAMIESGFSFRAHSVANAVGYWQFIEGTGKRYGLKINSYKDERRDPILSTKAAAQYFKDLYGIFASWHLALASYNAGEYRINRFVMRYYTRDFWSLSTKKSFPRETSNYIPKFIAAVRISKNPKKYGFHNIEQKKPLTFKNVKLKFPINLKKLSKKLQIPYKKIQTLNPSYRGVYAHSAGHTFIRVPVGTKDFVESTLAQYRMKKPHFVYSDHYWYRVRRGDTLSQLARSHKTKVSTIRIINKMRRRSMLLAGHKIKLPQYNKRIRQHNKKNKYHLAKSHRIKKGENLNSIAKKYGVNIKTLQKINSLSSTSDIIYPGQVLKLVLPNKRLIASVMPTSRHGKVHTIKKGETLMGISKAYKISLPALMKKNSFKFKSILQVGRQIIIP